MNVTKKRNYFALDEVFLRFNKYTKMITKWAAGSNMKRAFPSKITNSSAETKVFQLF